MPWLMFIDRNDKIQFLATPKALEIINSPEAENDEGVKKVMDFAMDIYNKLKKGEKGCSDGTSYSASSFPISAYVQWAKTPLDSDLILICDGIDAGWMGGGIIFKGEEQPLLDKALQTASPVFTN